MNAVMNDVVNAAENAPIVVGVDGSPPSLDAAGWAGREAAIHDVPLRILYAVPPTAWTREHATAEEALREAVIRARAGRPRLEVTAGVVRAGAREALVEAAREAEMVVVGNRGRGGFAELLLGSVSLHVAARAESPVAVVRTRREERDGDVVVGVPGRPGRLPEHVLDFAFREASLRGAVLRAVHAWTRPAASEPGSAQPLVYDVDEVAGEEARLLSEVLCGRSETFPDVEVAEETVHAHPAKALIDASAAAAVVVIGAGARPLLGLGAIAHAVVHHCRAPVIVLRE